MTGTPIHDQLLEETYASSDVLLPPWRVRLAAAGTAVGLIVLAVITVVSFR